MAKPFFRRFLGDDRAQDLVEYALLLACIALAGTVGIQALGGSIAGNYAASASTVSDAGSGGARGGGNPGNPTPGAGTPGQGNSGGGNPGKGAGSGKKP